MSASDGNPNLNQNIWALVAFLSALGAAEYWHLCWLKWMAAIPAAILTVLVVVSMVFYTLHYCGKKWLAFRCLGGGGKPRG